MYTYDLLFDRIKLPAPARETFFNIKDKIQPRFDGIRAAFFDGDSIDSIDSKICEIAAATGENEDGIWLAVCVMLADTTRELYLSRGIPEDIFYDTMSDITIWADVCRRDWGTWGIHGQFGWLSNHLRATLFRLGRLQFEIKHFRCDEYNKNGRSVRRGDPVMNIHIPEGDPLTKEKRFDSYRRAHDFFGMDVFVCDTWLFYPRHTEFLQPDSNILDFTRDFEIIDSSEKSGDYGNMWRIYGHRESYDPAELPRDTGMRRAYADWLAKENKTGSGYGVRFY